MEICRTYNFGLEPVYSSVLIGLVVFGVRAATEELGI